MKGLMKTSTPSGTADVSQQRRRSQRSTVKNSNNKCGTEKGGKTNAEEAMVDADPVEPKRRGRKRKQQEITEEAPVTKASSKENRRVAEIPVCDTTVSRKKTNKDKTIEEGEMFNFRLNYLRSRVTRLSPPQKLKSPSPSVSFSSERVNSAKPKQKRRRKNESGDQPPSLTRNRIREIRQRSASTDIEMPSLEREVPLEAIDLGSSRMLETVKKRERKAPTRLQDFVDDNEVEYDDGSTSEKAKLSRKQTNSENTGKEECQYSCKRCPTFFDTRTGLANHTKLHGAKKKYPCDLCDFSCESLKTLSVHNGFHKYANGVIDEQAEHTAEDNAAPNLQDIATDLDQKAKEEVGLDSGEKSSLNTLSKSSSDEEDETQDTSTQPIRCALCPFEAFTKRRMESHLEGHARTQGYKCSSCSFMSESPCHLKRHCLIHGKNGYKWPPVYVSAHKREQKTEQRDPSPEDHIDQCPIETLEPEADSDESIPPLESTDSEETNDDDKVNETTKGNDDKHSKYSCMCCGKHFHSPAAKKMHSLTKHAKERAVSEQPEKLVLSESNEDSKDDKSETTSTTDTETEHRCAHCPFTCAHKSRLLRHEKQHLLKAEHECTHCTFSCRSADILVQHLRLHQSPIKALRMPGRPKAILDEENDDLGNSKLERCGECPYTSRHTCDLKAHASMHIGKREFACRYCTYSTKRAHVLVAHEQLHCSEQMTNIVNHDEPKRICKKDGVISQPVDVAESSKFSCAHCPYETSTESELFEHNKDHGVNGLHHCQHCTYSTNIEDKMKEHLKIHPESKATTSKRAPYTKPNRLENGDYACLLCPFVIDDYMKYWSHKKRHDHGSRYKCDKCSYSVGLRACLEKHRTVHDTVQPVENFVGHPIETKSDVDEVPNTTVEGGSQFSVAASDSRVEMRKNGRLIVALPGDDKPHEFDLQRLSKQLPPLRLPVDDDVKHPEKFCCATCPYSSSDKMLYSMHMDLHQGERRPYKCILCSFSARSAESLHSHLSLHIPSLSPQSQKKRTTKRRYNLAQYEEDVIGGKEKYGCTKCAFWTCKKARFDEHCVAHARITQQRLSAIIKRTATTELSWGKPKVIRRAKIDRQLLCDKCTFRCDTEATYSRHSEYHGSKSFHTCRLCDYSAMTRKIVTYHETYHHLDKPLSFHYRDEVIAGKNTEDEHQKKHSILNRIICRRCSYTTLDITELSNHWETVHCNPSEHPSEKDLQLSEELRLRMVPKECVKVIQP